MINISDLRGEIGDTIVREVLKRYHRLVDFSRQDEITKPCGLEIRSPMIPLTEEELTELGQVFDLDGLVLSHFPERQVNALVPYGSDAETRIYQRGDTKLYVPNVNTIDEDTLLPANVGGGRGAVINVPSNGQSRAPTTNFDPSSYQFMYTLRVIMQEPYQGTKRVNIGLDIYVTDATGRPGIMSIAGTRGSAYSFYRPIHFSIDGWYSDSDEENSIQFRGVSQAKLGELDFWVQPKISDISSVDNLDVPQSDAYRMLFKFLYDHTNGALALPDSS